MPEITLRIDGMHCSACVRRVGQALASEGVAVKEIRIGAARIESDQETLLVDRALAAIEKAGYRAHVESGSEVNPAQAGK